MEGGAITDAPRAAHILSLVEEIVEERETSRPEGSYTTYLLEKGLDKVLKKVGEESTEVVVAAKNDQPEELSAEIADLLFHLLVLLRLRQLPLDRVWEVLEQRFGAAPRLPSARSSASAHPHS